MFGFNVGVSMSYMKVVGLMQKGAHAYASRIDRYIDVLPFEVEESDIDSTDAVLRAADVYLSEADAVSKVVNITPTPNYDFESMFGVPSVNIPTPEISGILDEPIIEPVVTDVSADIKKGPKAPVTQPAPTPQVQSKPQVPAPSSVPDLSGMTLKGQLQAIGKWATTTVIPEAVLFDAFGKSVVMKLVSEGYLVRTKKGILLGS